MLPAPTTLAIVAVAVALAAASTSTLALAPPVPTPTTLATLALLAPGRPRLLQIAKARRALLRGHPPLATSTVLRLLPLTLGHAGLLGYEADKGA